MVKGLQICIPIWLRFGTKIAEIPVSTQRIKSDGFDSLRLGDFLAPKILSAGQTWGRTWNGFLLCFSALGLCGSSPEPGLPKNELRGDIFHER